ncbi:MAG: DUF3365 domain-containing protein [Rubripirellula sp.]
MNLHRAKLLTTIAACFLTLVFPSGSSLGDENTSDRETVNIAKTPHEALARARLLHEMIRGALQVMHRDFFDEDNAHAIPSASLEDVFHALLEGHHVEVRWLNVQTDVLNVDHNPRDDFERKAAKEIAKGKQEFAMAGAKQYRFAGRIRLASQCLKCHVKNRNTTQDRAAGLLITMPLK